MNKLWLLLGLTQLACAHSIEEWEGEQEVKTEHLERALLVTADSLAGSWSSFVEWKLSRGIEVKVVTVEEIEKEVEGLDVQEKIRVFVQEELSGEGLRWLILGGDSLPGGGGLVPDRDTVHRTMMGDDTDIPTDIYYLSSGNWDADGDGIYGEFEDDREAIVYPDGTVGLGRIPVRTVADVEAYTSKVIAYEGSYPSQSFSDSFLYTCTVGGAYPKVRRSWDDWISKALKEGTVSRYFADETPWDVEEDGDYDLSASHWVKLFNEGRFGKVHLHGHGFIQGWVMEDNRSLFGLKHVEQLKNKDAYPMITTVSCFTGQFDAKRDPSIVEAMLRMPDAGAIAIVAPCREGKPHFVNPRVDFPAMMNEGKLDGTTRTMTQFWAKGVTDRLTAGEALMATKREQWQEAMESANFHMCLCELNLLGDPTLMVHQVMEKE